MVSQWGITDIAITKSSHDFIYSGARHCCIIGIHVTRLYLP